MIAEQGQLLPSQLVDELREWHGDVNRLAHGGPLPVVVRDQTYDARRRIAMEIDDTLYEELVLEMAETHPYAYYKAGAIQLMTKAFSTGTNLEVPDDIDPDREVVNDIASFRRMVELVGNLIENDRWDLIAPVMQVVAIDLGDLLMSLGAMVGMKRPDVLSDPAMHAKTIEEMKELLAVYRR